MGFEGTCKCGYELKVETDSTTKPEPHKCPICNKEIKLKKQNA